MNHQLFGVFGDRSDFSQFCNHEEFDCVIESDSVTIGIRDIGYGIPGRTTVYEGDDGVSVIWGEAVQETPQPPAKRLLEQYAERGLSAFDELNGSYLALVEYEGDALLVTDPIRSWEAFYTDAPGVRVFGTDATRVTQTIPDPHLNNRTVAEVIHFGTSFSDTTVVSELNRIPFDGYLTSDSTGELRRFVYRPQKFDYVDELAARLQRAIERRTSLPGRKGLLLGTSTECDSRIVLSVHPELDTVYTVGSSTDVSNLASQYNIEHESLPISDRNLDIRPEIIQYTQGIRESLHIRHRGNTSAIDADTIYHGALFDTLLRGRFLPKRDIELFGCSISLSRLDSNPDVVNHLETRLGYYESKTDLMSTQLIKSDVEQLPTELIEPPFESCWDRADSVHNAIDLFSIKQSPTLAFRTHLADHFLESFIAADRELIEWHLMTPPEHRTDRTFRAALEQLDDEIGKPAFCGNRNQIGTALKQIVPGLTTSKDSYPDLDVLFETNNLDEKLFPGYEEMHALPPRLKLRMNDLITWVEYATGEPYFTPDQLLLPPESLL
jgi:hypothetical protein